MPNTSKTFRCRCAVLVVPLCFFVPHAGAGESPSTDAQAGATRAVTSTPYGTADRSPDAPWRKSALERIDRLRKADLVVRVIDGDGKPVAGREVAVRQIRHAFPFGSAFRDQPLANNDRYAAEFLRLFNAAVPESSLKWAQWDRNPVSRPWADRSLGWAMEHGIRVRGHTLVWPAWEMTPGPGWKIFPPSLRQFENQPDVLQRKIVEHIEEATRYYRGMVWCWDVINEPVSWGGILRQLGEEKAVEWLKAARRGDPGAVLVVNGPFPETHGALRGEFESLIAKWRGLGAPIDAIGIQGHFAAHQLTSIPEVLADFDRFAADGSRLHITEFSASAPDRETQADYLRDYLTAAFSHPAVDCFMVWGFWEGAHFLKDRALFNEDWSPRPAGQVWEKLVFRDWWTDATVRTDENGEARLRVFKGDHRVSAGGEPVFCRVGDGGREIRLLVVGS